MFHPQSRIQTIEFGKNDVRQSNGSEGAWVPITLHRIIHCKGNQREFWKIHRSYDLRQSQGGIHRPKSSAPVGVVIIVATWATAPDRVDPRWAGSDISTFLFALEVSAEGSGGACFFTETWSPMSCSTRSPRLLMACSKLATRLSTMHFKPSSCCRVMWWRSPSNSRSTKPESTWIVPQASSLVVVEWVGGGETPG